MCLHPLKGSTMPKQIHNREKRIDMLAELDVLHSETICEIDGLSKKCEDERSTSKGED